MVNPSDWRHAKYCGTQCYYNTKDQSFITKYAIAEYWLSFLFLIDNITWFVAKRSFMTTDGEMHIELIEQPITQEDALNIALALNETQ